MNLRGIAMKDRLRSIARGWVLVLSALATACAPDLPKQATQDVANTVSGLSDAFGQMEKAYVTNSTDLWVVEVVASGQRVGETDACGEVEATKIKVVTAVNDALKRAQAPAPGPLSDEWQPLGQELQGHLDACALEVLPGRSRPVVLPPVAGLVSKPSHADINADFNMQYRVLLGALNDYYSSIARAAGAEDIAARRAAGESFVATGCEVVGKSASFFVMGANVAPLCEAVGNLVVAITTASAEAERYDAIERALRAVNNQTMEQVEDALGLSVVFMQANASNDVLIGRAQQEVVIFNAWDPDDRVGSMARLRAAMTAVSGARDAAPPALRNGIAQLSELHAQLTEEVAARDGSFQATFARLESIAKAADAARNAATSLLEGTE
jgi:hypothetical protein